VLVPLDSGKQKGLQKMNKIIQFCFIIVFAVAIAGCANSGNNMHANARSHAMVAAHAPTNPSDWQLFLSSHKNHKNLGKPYLNLSDVTDQNDFNDPATVKATKAFQDDDDDTAAFQTQLPQTGDLTWATYFKALRQPSSSKLRSARRSPKHVNAYNGGAGALTADAFHYPMKFGCTDQKNDPQVTDWQNFLICMGYMSTHNGTFDFATQQATSQFQMDNDPPLAINGTVDLNTYNRANTTYHADCPMNCTPVSGTCSH
jgi:hypothetical protein